MLPPRNQNQRRPFDINIGVKQHKLIALEIDSKYYENGFVINIKRKNNIHRHWMNNHSIHIAQQH